MEVKVLKDVEEIIFEEFKVYRISKKMQAIILLIKKYAIDQNLENLLLRQFFDIEMNESYVEKEIISIVQEIISSQKVFKNFLRQDTIDFMGQICKEIRLQVIKTDAKNLAKLIQDILLIKIDNQKLKDIYLHIIDYKETSLDVQNLISELTKKWHFNSFIDIFVGRAQLVNKIKQNHKEASFYGIDINPEELFFAIINMYINNQENWNFSCNDSIRQKEEKSDFDIAISEIPMLERVDIRGFSKYEFEYGIPRTYMDYFAIQRMLQYINSYGRVIAVVPSGTLFRTGIDGYIRKRIIKDDLVETVITLPEKMYEQTNAQVNILILNKYKPITRKNKIQFIDASEEYEKSYKKNILTKENIEKIVNTYWNEISDGENSIFLKNKELEEYEYSLFIWNKFRNKIKQKMEKDKLKIKDVAEIIRGIQITKEKYEKAKANGSTHYYITATDIDNKTGKINVREDSKIKPEERWIEKCEVKEGDLLLTMKGTSMKIGIIENIPKSIISGNLIIIRSQEKYDTYVLKEYLESPQGEKILKSIQKGTTVSIISPEDLGDIIIPDLTRKEQETLRKEIIVSEERYYKSLNEIKEKRREEKEEIYSKMNLGGI